MVSGAALDQGKGLDGFDCRPRKHRFIYVSLCPNQASMAIGEGESGSVTALDGAAATDNDGERVRRRIWFCSRRFMRTRGMSLCVCFARQFR